MTDGRLCVQKLIFTSLSGVFYSASSGRCFPHSNSRNVHIDEEIDIKGRCLKYILYGQAVTLRLFAKGNKGICHIFGAFAGSFAILWAAVTCVEFTRIATAPR